MSGDLIELQDWAFEKIEKIEKDLYHATGGYRFTLSGERNSLCRLVEKINSMLPLTFDDLSVGEFYALMKDRSCIRFKNSTDSSIIIRPNNHNIGEVMRRNISFSGSVRVVRLDVDFKGTDNGEV